MKTTILIVEDEKTISNFIGRTLEVNDYKPVVAATGAEAKTLFLPLPRPGSAGLGTAGHGRR